ncbi:hypothetical protein [Streptomyces sp. NPDC055607]
MPHTDTIPAATLRRWQLRGQKAIEGLLADAARLDLPPLTWTLAVSGAVTGKADNLHHSPDEQREAVRRWAAHVGVPVDTDHVDGREELYAGWKITVPDEIGAVHGCFRAIIFPGSVDAAQENR